jgi:hypothetical protein
MDYGFGEFHLGLTFEKERPAYFHAALGSR